jgi:hypothetical protein
MKKFLYETMKHDPEWLSVYKQYNNNNLKGFKSTLKNCIDFFINDFDIYLEKPYIDVSYLRYKNKLIDLDLLHDIVINHIKERVQS